MLIEEATSGAAMMTTSASHLATPTAVRALGACGLNPMPFADLVGVLRHDDILTAIFATGSRATLVGID